jgi:hypothetical protein
MPFLLKINTKYKFRWSLNCPLLSAACFASQPVNFAKGGRRFHLENSHISLSRKWFGGVGAFLGFEFSRRRHPHSASSTAVRARPGTQPIWRDARRHCGTPTRPSGGRSRAQRRRRRPGEERLGAAAAFRSKRSPRIDRGSE